MGVSVPGSRIKSIQRGLNSVTTTASVTITAVNTAKTTVNAWRTGAPNGVGVYLYNSTTLQLNVDTGVTANVWWEVIEWM